MNFYDLDPMSLPKDAEYYFGITILELLVPIGSIPADDYWDISHITDAQPYAIHAFPNDRVGWTVYPNTVVEIRRNEVSFYADDDEEEDYDFC